jgi:hypothetical protein
MAVVFGVVGLFERRLVVIGDAKELSAVSIAVTRACEIQETGQERPFRIAMRFEADNRGDGASGGRQTADAASDWRARRIPHRIWSRSLLKRFVELVEHRRLNYLPGKRVVHEIRDGHDERMAKRQRERDVLLDGVVLRKEHARRKRLQRRCDEKDPRASSRWQWRFEREWSTAGCRGRPGGAANSRCC